MRQTYKIKVYYNKHIYICNLKFTYSSTLCHRKFRIMAKKIKETDESFNNLIQEIADKLKQLRIDAGYTSYENFAWDNGINRMQYWKMEKGETNFTMKSLHRVLEAHKMSLDEFFKGIK